MLAGGAFVADGQFVGHAAPQLWPPGWGVAVRREQSVAGKGRNRFAKRGSCGINGRGYGCVRKSPPAGLLRADSRNRSSSTPRAFAQSISNQQVTRTPMGGFRKSIGDGGADSVREAPFRRQVLIFESDLLGRPVSRGGFDEPAAVDLRNPPLGLLCRPQRLQAVALADPRERSAKGACGAKWFIA